MASTSVDDKSAKAAEARPRKRKGQSAADRVGERVATHRKDRHLKVSELARLVGVSPSLISQIERGQSQPSVATLFALAESLDVPVDAFFVKDGGAVAAAPAQPPAAKPTESDGAAAAPAPTQAGDAAVQGVSSKRYVVRRDARSAINIEGGVLWERLTPETLPHVDFLELIYEPGAESNPELYRHPGSEMVLVLSGRFDIYVGFERYELGPGDSIHFPSTFPHRYVNPTDDVSRAVTVILHDGERPMPADADQPRP
jgi:DNA-binding XRE family transcriptional regulator/quercetin dioxygenase-like cupin family protein